MRRALLAAAAMLGAALMPAHAEPVLLHAAGSLREALGEVAQAFERSPGGAPVSARYGPSGLLRDEIAGGAKAEVFASANMEHPLALTRSGKAGPTVLFARNRLCALVRPELVVTTATLLDKMLDPAVKLGTSTPGADPSGDYAWQAFRRAEGVRPGSRAALEAKALRLTGGPDSPKPPPDRSLYGAIVARGDADIFLTYCTNAAVAVREVAGASAVPLPEEMAVGADYGLSVMRGSPEAAYRLAFFILSGEGQAILARHGFASVAVPAAAQP